MKINMFPVKLDSSSTKKIPVVGDVLYSTVDEKLTLDTQTNSVDNIPIAICVIPEVYENFENGDESTGAIKTARFVSINYMNYEMPTTGSKDPQYMMFGNYKVAIGNIKGKQNSYTGGKWNTQQCLFKVTNQNICDGNDKIINSNREGYCSPACCCAKYSTPGTKPGDWYLPSVVELYQIYKNKTIIDKKRTTLVGSGFDGYYWSSREYSSYTEYYINIDKGSIFDGSKSSLTYVLAFLAVEV